MCVYCMMQTRIMFDNTTNKMGQASLAETELLTPTQLAALLQITPQGVSNLKSRGRIRPVIAIGKIVRYRYADVLAQMSPAKPEILA